jgi:hypothetical protein
MQSAVYVFHIMKAMFTTHRFKKSAVKYSCSVDEFESSLLSSHESLSGSPVSRTITTFPCVSVSEQTLCPSVTVTSQYVPVTLLQSYSDVTVCSGNTALKLR